MAAKFGDGLILVLSNDINNQQEGFGLIQRKKKNQVVFVFRIS